MGIEELDGLESVGDFTRQQVPVLKTNLRGLAFEMNVDPSVPVKAVRSAQALVGPSGFRRSLGRYLWLRALRRGGDSATPGQDEHET
jgi:hypothetical protein